MLLVDDNTRYRQQLSRMIGKVSPSSLIYEAENMAEALSLGEQIQPQLALIDVVLEEVVWRSVLADDTVVPQPSDLPAIPLSV